MEDEDKKHKFSKTTSGFVTQTFERDHEGIPKCTGQEFICGSDVDFEDEDGEPCEAQEDAYQPYIMRLH
jgi:hypothetical protein